MSDEDSAQTQRERAAAALAEKREQLKLEKELKAARHGWARREARKAAIDKLHEQALSGQFDENSRQTWDSLTADQQSHFLETKKLPSKKEFGSGGYEFSHMYSMKEYDSIGHEPNGVLKSREEHIFGDHGGDTKVTLHGAPRNPDYAEQKEEGGMQMVDIENEEREKTKQEDLDAELLKSHPELKEKIEKAKAKESREKGMEK